MAGLFGIFVGFFALFLLKACLTKRKGSPRRVECTACSEDMIDTGRDELYEEEGSMIRVWHCPRCGNEIGVRLSSDTEPTARR